MHGVVQEFRKAFGERIQDLRKAADLSQEELAARARVHSSYLSDVERGRQSPTLDVVYRLARALKMTLGDLFAPLDGPYKPTYRKRRSDRSKVI